MLYYNQKEGNDPNRKEMTTMMDYRHSAYNLTTGEIINSNSGNYLKREVARADRFDKEVYGIKGQWRWSHDFGKNWLANGLPER